MAELEPNSSISNCSQQSPSTGSITRQLQHSPLPPRFQVHAAQPGRNHTGIKNYPASISLSLRRIIWREGGWRKMSADMMFLLIKLCTFQLLLTAKGAPTASPASCRNLPRQSFGHPTYRCVLAGKHSWGVASLTWQLSSFFPVGIL